MRLIDWVLLHLLGNKLGRQVLDVIESPAFTQIMFIVDAVKRRDYSGIPAILAALEAHAAPDTVVANKETVH